MRGRTSPRLRTALVGAAASVALVAGVGFVATSPVGAQDGAPREADGGAIQLVQATGASIVEGQAVDIDLKELVEKQIGQTVPADTTLTLTGLPPGLKQDGWKITGTPTENGLFTVGVEVRSGGQTSKKDVQLVVAPPAGEAPDTSEKSPSTGAEETTAPSTTTEDESESTTTSGAETTAASETTAPTSEKSSSTTSPGSTESSGSSESTTPSTSTPSTSTPSTSTPSTSAAKDGGTKIDLNDLDGAPGSLVDGMEGGKALTGSLGANKGESGTGEAPTCDTSDLTAGLEKLLPTVVGEGQDSGMITSIITSVLGSLLPTLLDSASSGGGSACEAGNAAGSLLEGAAGIQEGAGGTTPTTAAKAATQGGTGGTTLDGLGAGDTAQLLQLVQLAQGIMGAAGQGAGK